MKKQIIFLSLLIPLCKAASAQLTNSKWKGTANVPDPLPSVLDFRKDSVTLFVQDSPVETMSFQLKGDTLILTKLDGLSPCGPKSTGQFKIAWKDGSFTLSSLTDECPERAAAFIVEPWVRIKNE